MTDTTTNLALPQLIAAQAQKHVTVNEALRALDALVQLAVLDRDPTSPPGSPAEGARWIVGAGASGDWAGHDDDIAAWQDGGWSFYPPQIGWLAYVVDEGALVAWTGSAWADAIFTPAALHNMTLLGVGTTADGTNPFSAKLNNALWVAKTVAEGGDGNLRYKMSKESAAKTLSLLLQDDFSGRAEIGLVGSDDLSVKVSPDGSAWTDALRVQKDDGATVFQAPMTIQVDSGNAVSIDLQEGNSVFQATRYADSSNAPVFFGRKARGTRAAPTAVQAGDTLIGFRGYGYTGSGFLAGAEGAAFLLEAAEGFVAGSNYGTQIRFFTTPNGAIVSAERLRIADSGDVQMGGANTVINASRHPVLRGYTVATLPDASAAGQLIYVSDGSTNRRLAVSDGVNWRWPDGAVVS